MGTVTRGGTSSDRYCVRSPSCFAIPRVFEQSKVLGGTIRGRKTARKGEKGCRRKRIRGKSAPSDLSGSRGYVTFGADLEYVFLVFGC